MPIELLLTVPTNPQSKGSQIWVVQHESNHQSFLDTHALYLSRPVSVQKGPRQDGALLYPTLKRPYSRLATLLLALIFSETASSSRFKFSLEVCGRYWDRLLDFIHRVFIVAQVGMHVGHFFGDLPAIVFLGVFLLLFLRKQNSPPQKEKQVS